jgi:hypothetical protein
LICFFILSIVSSGVRGFPGYPKTCESLELRQERGNFLQRTVHDIPDLSPGVRPSHHCHQLGTKMSNLSPMLKKIPLVADYLLEGDVREP